MIIIIIAIAVAALLVADKIQKRGVFRDRD